uniref:SGNH domain-containing protein n=2 Tax=Caenorhabditis tropicalis TaxID=1561998 RepID=A0A1I7V044_9PELO
MKYVSYKMFILTSIPEIEHSHIEMIVPTMKKRENLIKFDKSFVHTSPESARRRHSKLIENCDRCIPIDYKPLFWNTTTDTWRFYDEKNNGLSYMTQVDHLNYHGLELIRNVYTNICRKL